MVSKVMIIGRLGRDPELRYVAGGEPVTTLNSATDESYMGRDGNRVGKTEWHRVTVWGKSAENCSNFLSKGSLVYVGGSLQTRRWQDQQGQDRYSTDIRAQRVQFLDRKGERPPREDGDQNFDSDFERNPKTAGQQGKGGGFNLSKGASGRNQNDMEPAGPSESGPLDEVPF